MILKRIFKFFIICTVPLFLLLSSYQAYNYLKLEQEVIEQEKEQKQWLEKNKKIIASISVLRTPERIEKIAQDKLDLKRIDTDRIIKVVFE